ncbi:YueH family protein [Mesobacillus harenae]|uniref:YueH family protein n=1 Tax=Mesobacillus harenae TaxID=2213203 RepID=UPI00157FD943|nr:YueH family protein [Mesobacillus harenae]
MLYGLTTKSRDKLTEVYINNLTDTTIIIAIPEIHWSIIISAVESEAIQYESILRSLVFQLFQGNAEELTKEITLLLKARR